MGTIMIDFGLERSLRVSLLGVIQEITVLDVLSHQIPPEENYQPSQGLLG